MNNKPILLIITLLILSSCSLGKSGDLASTGSILINNTGIVNDTKSGDEVVDEFEDEIEDLFKILEDNAE